MSLSPSLAGAAAWVFIAGCGSRTGLAAGGLGFGVDAGDGGGLADGDAHDSPSSSGDGAGEAPSDDARPDVDGSDVDSADVDGTSGDCGVVGLITLATKQRSVSGVAVDATQVYWTTFVGGTVMKASLCGGAPVTLATSAGPTYIAVDGKNVYWTQSDGAECPACIAILRVPSGGGPATSLASQVNASSLGLAVNGTTVYWVAEGEGVMSVPSIGGTVTTLVSEPGGVSSGIALDSTNAYWTYVSLLSRAVAVMSVPLSGGPPALLASGPSVASDPATPSLAVSSTSIYWGTSSTLQGQPKSGGAAVDLPVPWGPTLPGDLTVDETSVYWVNAKESAVLKAPLAGGPPVTIATGQSHPRAIAVDATSVYWATSSLVGPDDYGDVMRMTPK